MPRAKTHKCTADNCTGVMRLANVADGIPLWECRKCDHTDQHTKTASTSVYVFEREAPGDAYTPFSDDDPDPALTWDEFTAQYEDKLTQA